ncbi:hypothetical protein GWK90_08040 [Candidatus Hamiltonella defensa]|nr:iron-containing alcohol dehydrogenase family protein [Candidatus Hamiltonella defensa]MBK4362150.1 hypothetical protein [Candidatus Hamiltonella defensa]
MNWGVICRRWAAKCFLLANNAVWTIVEARVKTSLKKADITYRYKRFNG